MWMDFFSSTKMKSLIEIESPLDTLNLHKFEFIAVIHPHIDFFHYQQSPEEEKKNNNNNSECDDYG